MGRRLEIAANPVHSRGAMMTGLPIRVALATVFALSTMMVVTGEQSGRAQDTGTASAPLSPPIRLDVAEFQVIPVYAAPRQPPHVEHLFDTSPQSAATAWAERTFKAAGVENRGTFIIRDASVVETKLKKDSGLSSMFTKEPAERYDGVLSAELDIRDNFDKFLGRVTARVTRSQTVLEDTEPAERQAIWKKMTRAMIADLDRELRKQIKLHLASYLR